MLLPRIAAALFSLLAATAHAASLPGPPLRVYATASPQGDIIRYVQKLAAADGSGLELKLTTSGGSGTLDSYELLANKDTDVNFTGHQPYVTAWKAAHPSLDNFSGKATVLVNAFGLYSERYKNAQDLPEGARILVPERADQPAAGAVHPAEPGFDHTRCRRARPLRAGHCGE
ncbi:MetQ/NlpA family ABC transporter substrate-binding protein [Pseudomonas sp. KNUC1026]|uniref:MetQ/NlpA family ABC transporter substrate-binding protein n=1 Tax=Pseudomonas sp. KNUC1026 TaxID=2893890 RepID=UPI001F316FD8|nr:MetQ/NlpA family ABC transporter substrate-binding protein [Pseudomonas sp. KNUC1026]UFH48208.1 MetQ/NlpA family ABC transporter substrate-binding protein [Pseudomonas sp. KNUC1026]